MMNDSESTITDLSIDYNIYVRNDKDRSSSFNLSVSYNNSSYASLCSGEYESPEIQSGSTWIVTTKAISLSGLSIAPGDDYYIRWTGTDVAGTGGRDEFVLDDLIISVAIY